MATTIRSTPRSVQPQPQTAARRSEERQASTSTVNPLDAFQAFNPMTYWANAVGASLQMFSPLGYGAMRGPIPFY